MKPLLILQCEVLAVSVPAACAVMGETHEQFLRALDCGDLPVIISRTCDGEAPPPLDAVSAVVVTGSSAMVADRAEWIIQAASWLRHAFEADIPLLGVCFGHQLLAHALGGRVAPLLGGPEYGTVEVMLTQAALHDPLFSDCPDRFPAQAAHYQTVQEPPPNALVLGESASGIQALRFGALAWGVQFHPEFSAQDLRVLIESLRTPLTASGCDVNASLRRLGESHAASRVLPRFAELVRTHASRTPAIDFRPHRHQATPQAKT
jgi:GMP synthase (glutamine-hydrolysing)